MSDIDTILGPSIIKRIVKEEMPQGYQLTSEALGHFSRASAIFALYHASTASDLAKDRNRRNISTADIRKALEEIDLPEFVDALSGDLRGFQEKRNQKKLVDKARRGDGGIRDDGVEEAKTEGSENAIDGLGEVVEKRGEFESAMEG